MSALTRRAILAFVMAVGVSVPLEVAEARGIKVRASSSSSNNSTPSAAPAEAPATEAASNSTPEKDKGRNSFMMRAERALEEERLGDTEAAPMFVKPTGSGATLVTGPAATERMQCIAGC